MWDVLCVMVKSAPHEILGEILLQGQIGKKLTTADYLVQYVMITEKQSLNSIAPCVTSNPLSFLFRLLKVANSFMV
jgi:hypothetical protein